MTREERVDWLCRLRSYVVVCRTNFTVEHISKFIEALSEEIEALQTESCEDAISRQAVLDELERCHITSGVKNQGTWNECVDSIMRTIGSMSSVQSESKTGYWIKEETICGWDGKSYQCSCCGRSIHLDTVIEDLDDYPYCHCGAKMVESQESEDVEPKTGHWILVSERLPKEFESVLVCYKSQGGMAQCVSERLVNTDGSNRWSAMYGQEPIAWMPLPEPWKES